MEIIAIYTEEYSASTIKKEFETILSDTITEGSALGKFQPSITIFCLKNWYGWADMQKVDVKANVNNTLEYVIKPIDKETESE